MPTARKTRGSRKKRLSLRGLLLLLILAVLLVLSFALGWIKFGTPQGELEPLSYLNAQSPYCFTGTGFAYMDNSTLLHEDFGKKNVWSISLGSPDVRLAASPTITAVFNVVAMQAMSTQTGDQLFPSFEYTGTVEAVRCSKSYIAVLKKDTRNVNSLYLYDAKGTRLDSFSLGSNTVLDFGFYGETEKFYTLALNTEGVTPISTITTFNTGQSNTGIMPIEGQIVDKLFFNEESAIYAAGTYYLMSFDSVGKETARRLIYGWKVLDYELASGKPTFLLAPRKQSDAAADLSIAKIITLPEGGTTDAFVNLPAKTLGTFLCAGKVVVITPNEYYQYSLKGDLIKRVPLKSTIEKAQKLDATRLLLSQGSTAYLLEIK